MSDVWAFYAMLRAAIMGLFTLRKARKTDRTPREKFRHCFRSPSCLSSQEGRIECRTRRCSVGRNNCGRSCNSWKHRHEGSKAIFFILSSVKMANVFLQYFRDPEATEKAFQGGYFHSGDLAVMDPDGSIKIVDRSKDLIISGGENASSIAIEQGF
jgi:hypothetical protein